MRAIAIARDLLQPQLTEIHQARLNAFFIVVEALVAGGKLSLTAMGRSTRRPVAPRHNIKRVDRLLGNSMLQAEVPRFCAALAEVALQGQAHPVLLVDWTNVGHEQDALVAAAALDGRAIPIYFEVHPRSRYNKPDVHRAFLAKLASVLPRDARPIVVTDAGFANSWFTEVRSVGWHFVGRLSKQVLAYKRGRWESTASQFRKVQPGKVTDLGANLVSRNNPILARVVLHRGRRLTKASAPVSRSISAKRSRHAGRHRRLAGEPWVLATSMAAVPAADVVSCYGTRMQIEETFRDAKCHRFGWSLDQARASDAGRMSVLLLIGAIGMLTCLVIGQAAEAKGLHRDFQANSIRQRRVLPLFTLGNLVVRSPRYLSVLPTHQLRAALHSLAVKMQSLAPAQLRIRGDP